MFSVLLLRSLLLLLRHESVFSSASPPPTVKIADGVVNGFTLNGTNAFRSIPYAAPPIGNLRFHPPQPPLRWKTPLDGTNYGPSCLQMGYTYDKVQGPAWNTLNLTKSSEDCLYLNVYTPSSNNVKENKLPVMVYLHAGEFRFGSSNDLENSWPYFSKGRIILVTANVRLGYFGFAALNELRSNDPNNSTGNYGLQDQRYVLKWVKKNIEAFGGDINKITIFGESSGGSSVAFHTTSKESQQYFNRAIMESPGLTQSHSWYQSETNTQFLLSSLTSAGCNGCRWDVNSYRDLPGLTLPFIQPSASDIFLTIKDAKDKCNAMVDCLMIMSKPKLFSKKLNYILITTTSKPNHFNESHPMFFENVTKIGQSNAQAYSIALRLALPIQKCLFNAAASDIVSINLGTP